VKRVLFTFLLLACGSFALEAKSFDTYLKSFDYAERKAMKIKSAEMLEMVKIEATVVRDC